MTQPFPLGVEGEEQGHRGAILAGPSLIPLFPCQGKEFETRLKEKKPGDLSDELRIALGMPVGPVSGKE